MKLRFLGTAAAEGWPAIFCECEGCKKARENGGKDLRHRCAYMIDDDTMVDFGPDVYAQSISYGIDLAKLKYLFITHGHTDHFTPKELNFRSGGYSDARNNLDLYANQYSLDLLTKCLYKPVDEFHLWKITPYLMEPGNTIQAGDMTVTAIRADHAGPEQIPLNYIIQRQGVTLFIGNDSGWWSDESWDIMSRFKLDIAVLECTYGIKWPDQRVKHMGAGCTVAVRDEMAKRGMLKEDSIVVATHFSHNCQDLHSDFEAYFNPRGIIVAYDGMVVEK